ncbi:excinuclease ABC subunit A [uncultured Campylobacter sp.]|uniref:excinuclease ABC subunit A n=1 Tax=uncultured Campylobacter sp. TaxID=218934 RepID=UPI00260F7367|nr:excinuclease ABC subunit A [uncultured Campylobacter sp.]
MRIFAALLLFFVALWGSNLSTYNVYERSDRVDIMLSFDAPYSGAILQERKDGAITLLFTDLQNDQNIEKSVNSSILQELLFEPRGQNLALVIKSDAQVAVSASKTTDGFGLRIRVTSENAANSAAATTLSPQETRENITEATNLSGDQNASNLTASAQGAGLNLSAQNGDVNFMTQGMSDMIDYRYYSVLGVLALLLLTLLFIKTKLKNKQNAFKTKQKNDWFEKVKKDEEVEIIYEKQLDGVNKVVLFQHLDRRYLVLTGASNVLLDKFGEEKMTSEQDFQSFFEENQKKLNAYIENRQPLDAYKDKASID